MDQNLALESARLTEASTPASADRTEKEDGRPDRDIAVEAMRLVFGSNTINGKIIIGKGEPTEAPMFLRAGSYTRRFMSCELFLEDKPDI